MLTHHGLSYTLNSLLQTLSDPSHHLPLQTYLLLTSPSPKWKPTTTPYLLLSATYHLPSYTRTCIYGFYTLNLSTIRYVTRPPPSPTDYPPSPCTRTVNPWPKFNFSPKILRHFFSYHAHIGPPSNISYVSSGDTRKKLIWPSRVTKGTLMADGWWRL
jgi:hypothetical protein